MAMVRTCVRLWADIFEEFFILVPLFFENQNGCVQDFPKRAIQGISVACWKERMNRSARLILGCAGLLFVAVLAGCATSGQRMRYVQPADSGSVTNLLAYRAGTNLQI